MARDFSIRCLDACGWRTFGLLCDYWDEERARAAAAGIDVAIHGERARNRATFVVLQVLLELLAAVRIRRGGITEEEIAMDIKVSTIRKWHFLLLALGIMGSSMANAQTVCGPEVREAAAREIDAIAGLPEQERAAAEATIYSKYKHCAQDAHGIPTNDPFFVAARECGATVSQLGSLAFEEMSCCGYDPQRRQFGCPIKIKQTNGFGGGPLPGSRLYVLSCVADTGGAFVPVAVDSVHVSNEFLGQNPTWQFAVVASANQNLQLLQPMSGATRRARSILSWNSQPTSCNYQPTWGDALNYRIRLNQ